MLSTLKSLIGVTPKGNATAAELEVALVAARAEIDAAERACADVEAAYTAGLMSLEACKLQQLIADRQTAAIRRDHAVALAEAVAGRLVNAQAAEEQAERRRNYDDALKARASAAKVLTSEYPTLARSLMAVMRTVAEADARVKAANDALPDGAESLSSVEGLVRREENKPERVTEQLDFTAWCRLGGTRLHRDEQSNVTPAPDGRTGLWKPIGVDPVPVVLRRFRRITRTLEANGRRSPSLAKTLNLPGLRPSHVPFWTADAAESPGSILATIDGAQPNWGKSIGRTIDIEFDPVTEIVPLDEPDERAAA